MSQSDKELLAEMRQPYRTPSERARDRAAQAAAQRAIPGPATRLGGSFGALELPERPAGAPAPNLRLNLWEVRAPNGQIAYVRCPSRSGAKIFMSEKHGWKGPFTTASVEDSDVPAGHEILLASFKTVQEFAAEVEAEKKGKR